MGSVFMAMVVMECEASSFREVETLPASPRGSLRSSGAPCLPCYLIMMSSLKSVWLDALPGWVVKSLSRLASARAVLPKWTHRVGRLSPDLRGSCLSSVVHRAGLVLPRRFYL